MRIKIYLLALLIGIVNTHENIEALSINIANGRFVESAVISQLFEMIRRLIFTGNTSSGIPVLDPHVSESLHIEIHGKKISLDANITNGIFSGLGSFNIVRSDFDKGKITIDLQCNFPSLVYHSDSYEMGGFFLQVFPVSGKGVLHLEANNLNFSSKVYLKQSPDGKSILIKNLENPVLHVETIICNTEFDNIIDPIVSALVEDLLADLINELSQVHATTLSVSFINYLNPILDKFETWGIISVIL